MLSTSSKELGTRHQTPTLIGCIFLKTPQNKSDQNLLHFANPAAISEALNSSTVFEELSKLFVFSSPFVLATPAACSNHLHRAKPCILYRFLTRSEQKPNFLRQPSKPSAAAPKHRHKPPREPERFCNQASAAKPSTIARITPLSRENPQIAPKSQRSPQTHQLATDSTASVYRGGALSTGDPRRCISRSLPNVA